MNRRRLEARFAAVDKYLTGQQFHAAIENRDIASAMTNVGIRPKHLIWDELEKETAGLVPEKEREEVSA